MEVQQTLTLGTFIKGKVIKHMPFGVFLELDFPFIGLIQITDFKDEEIMKEEEYPPVGTWIKAVVLGFTDENRKQIWLGVKPSLFLKAQHDNIK